MAGLDRLYIGTNTKMYQTPGQTARFLEKLANLTGDIPEEKLTLFVIPSFTSLERAAAAVNGGRILLGAQNMHWEEEGQYTGEISPLMLKELGISIAEIGHSERRHLFHETDEQLQKKVRSAVEHNLTALLCVGETGEQRGWDVADEVLRMQIKIGLHGLRPEQADAVWVAYEPVWAIGKSGIPAKAEYVAARHAAIRQALKELFGAKAAVRIPLLYGGSVNPENARELIGTPEVDGLFIGRSAWEADRFNRLIRSVLNS